MLKPRHSFQAVVSELVQGLRNGEVILGRDSAPSVPLVQRVRFRQSSRVYVSIPGICYVNVRWSGHPVSSEVH
jgi:hypothetical protein